MEERIRLTVDDMVSLVNSMVACRDVLEIENEKLQDSFKNLQEDFQDAYYNEFEVEFKKGDKAVGNLRDSLSEIIVAIGKYTASMMDNA